MQGKIEEKFPVFFAKASAGYPFAPLADIRFQPRLKGGNALQVNASYNGFYSMMNTLQIDENTHKIVQNKDIQSYSSNTAVGAGATYSHHWKNGKLVLEFGYSTNSNSYYGAPVIPNATPEMPIYSKLDNKNFIADSCSHNWQQLRAKFSIGSVNAKVSKVHFHYNLNATYLNTSDKYLQEKVRDLMHRLQSLWMHQEANLRLYRE